MNIQLFAKAQANIKQARKHNANKAQTTEIYIALFGIACFAIALVFLTVYIVYNEIL